MYGFHASKFLSNFSMLKLFLNSLYFWLKYKCDTNTYFHLFHSFLYFMQIIFYLYKVWQTGIIKKKSWRLMDLVFNYDEVSEWKINTKETRSMEVKEWGF